MGKPMGHYIVKEGDHIMVCWYAGESFYKAGSATPYNKNHFDEISKEPLELDNTQPTVKGTRW